MHLFVCESLFSLCLELWPCAGRLADSRDGIRALRGVGDSASRVCLSAIGIDAAWSALIAGVAQPDMSEAPLELARAPFHDALWEPLGRVSALPIWAAVPVLEVPVRSTGSGLEVRLQGRGRKAGT